MKKVFFILLISVSFIFLISLAKSSEYSYKFIDRNKVFMQLGFERGKFDKNNAMVQMLSNQCDMSFLSIEGSKYLADTEEEFLTANFFYPLVIDDAKKKYQLDKEIPRNIEGSLKLGAMWMKKKAEYVNRTESYMIALNLIQQKSGISEQQIKDYYSKAMEKELLKLGNNYLGFRYTEKELMTNILKPTYNYYMHPTNANFQDVVKKGLSFAKYDRSGRAIKGYYDIFSSLDVNLKMKLESEIQSDLMNNSKK